MPPGADGNRRGWLELLRQWRHQDVIDDRDEGDLVRHYDERTGQLRAALKTLAPEYTRRVRDEGQEQADRWLRDTAREMGRGDGEATRRMLESISR